MIPVARPDLDEKEVEAAAEVIRSGMLASGPRVEEFETAFSNYCRTAHSVAVNNGTAALHATLLALGIGPGEEVIVPAFTFFATASAVCMSGAKPVFADVDEDSFNISIDSVQELVNQRTRAVIGVHLFGQPFAIRAIQEICGERGIPFIEDAAQAHGATYHGKKVGGWGTAGCFSFYATKNMTTGEGGMVTTNDPGLAQKTREIINHGQAEKYLHVSIGYNFRMSDLSAAIGLVQLAKLDGFNARRRENAAYYDACIRAPGIILPKVTTGVEHVYHQYVVKVTGEGRLSRDQLSILLREKGIATAVHYPVPLHKQPVFEEYAGYGRCPVAEKLAAEVLSIPVHPLLTDEEREYICRCINEVE
ncbi:MAG TPA: DegT/DnrJ/EryC1/StrS family aminotransferase [Methanoregulaceae archaeon]|nr:DegT/DnrJ/EryC1/StrS family aminotransferase [Methanoregulaceae archaeon]